MMSDKQLLPNHTSQHQPTLDMQEEEIIASGSSSRLTILVGVALLLLVVGYTMMPKSHGQSLANAATPLVVLDGASKVASGATGPVPGKGSGFMVASNQAPTAPTALVSMTGRIVDENGKPLVGATVLLRGTNKGTGTDAKGNYSFEVPPGDNTLVFGYGGYEDQVLQTRSTRFQTITLTPKADVGKRRRR